MLTDDEKYNLNIQLCLSKIRLYQDNLKQYCCIYFLCLDICFKDKVIL